MTPIDPFRDRLREHARATRCRIVFTDGDRPQVIQAAQRFQAEGSIYPILISLGAVLEIESIHPASSPDLSRYVEYLEQRFAARNLPVQEAGLLARKPVYFGLIAIACGDADGCISTAEIGKREIAVVSSAAIPVSQIRADMSSEDIYSVTIALAGQVARKNGR